MFSFDRDSRTLFLRWLLQQGVSTVLLFLILIGAAWTIRCEVPEHIRLINAGMMDREQLRDHRIRSIRESFERDQERDERRYQDLLQRRLAK